MLRNILMALVLSGLSSHALATENDADFEEIELKITDRMESLGYPMDEVSLPFYGLAAMASQAVLREQGLAYHNRMENILGGVEPINEKAFFDGVIIYSKFKPLDLKIPIAKNVEDSTVFLEGGNDTKEDTLPHLADKFLASFDKDKLTSLLKAMKKENPSTPFSLLMTTEERAVQVGFDGTAWLSVNHGKTTYGKSATEVEEVVNISEAVDNIFQGQDIYDDRLIASVEVLSANRKFKSNSFDSIKHNEVLRLSPENKQQNLTFVNLALRQGHTSYVTEFLQQILSSNLDSSDMVELLVAKDERGTGDPGFYYALVAGHIDVITNFTQQILSSDLDWSDIVEILSAKESDDFTGFDIARHVNSKDGIEAFEKVVENAPMQQSQKDTLLAVARGKQTIIHRMRELNYQVDEGGICYGLAAMAAQAVIRSEGKKYYDRIQEIKFWQSPDPYDDEAKLAELAFFDGVTMYDANILFSEQEDFKVSDSQNIELPAKLFSGNAGESRYKVPKVCDKFLSVLTKESLIAFLEVTRSENKAKPFSIFISYDDHAVQIGFDGKAWLAVNHDVTRYSKNFEDLVQVVLPEDYRHDDVWIATINILSSDGKIKTTELSSIKHDGVFDLSTEHKKQNRTTVNMALRSGLTDIAINFTQQVLDSWDIKSSDKTKLLSAKNRGRSIFHSMLFYVNSDIAINFTKQILGSNLEPSDKVELLTAKSNDGNLGLYTSFSNGDVEMVTKFTQQVLESNLEQSHKVELLAAKSSAGSTGLSTAKLFGKTEVVQAFEQAVNASTLEQSYKDELLKR